MAETWQNMPQTPSCFSCKKSHTDACAAHTTCVLCVCGVTYCDACLASDQHKEVCGDSFHIRAKKVLELVERKGRIIVNAGNGLSSNMLFLRHGICKPFKTSLFPHIVNSSISNCIICGKINNNLKYRLVRRNRTNCYYADICNECDRKGLFICSHTYLPSDKCINGKWCKDVLYAITMLRSIDLIPMDVVKYIYEYMWSIDINMRMFSTSTSKHTCTRHFDIYTDTHY
jgi:hypothetical protein